MSWCGRQQAAAEALVKPGVRLCDIDAAARDLITEAGYGPTSSQPPGPTSLVWKTTRPVTISAVNENVVTPGMCFSIEPGIYLSRQVLRPDRRSGPRHRGRL